MNDDTNTNSVAIIGISGKFPGAHNIQSFWKNLCESKSSFSTFSKDELRDSGVPEQLIDSPNYVRKRGILDDIDLFDEQYFGLSPQEARLTDPQHRIFLECASEAFNNAGYDPLSYKGKVGVFAGTSMSTYYLHNVLPNQNSECHSSDFQQRIGNDKDFLTTRVSHKLNLKGPSLNIQTACSTSLVSLCIACNQLLSFECDMALAGGVSIQIPQKEGYEYKEGLILSPDGSCRPFDAQAKGTVMSNGAGVVLLKRFEDALDDGDHIYAVVKGYAMNNDGADKISYSAPSSEGQAEVIASAIAMAEVNPETIGYVEAHGTGTLLGDPVEIEGLKKGFATHKTNFCAIGSVKSNIGHTQEAAGIIGFIKAVLALHHKKIPPSLNYSSPNPHIEFDQTPFYVNTKLMDWEKQSFPRRAGVSSFGIGGTNAHVVLEEYEQSLAFSTAHQQYPILIGAKTKSAALAFAHQIALFIKANPKTDIGHLAFTLFQRNKNFDYTKVIEATTSAEAEEKLVAISLEDFQKSGCGIDPSFFESAQFNRIPLPNYPFEKKSHWINAPFKKIEPDQSLSSAAPSSEKMIKKILMDYLGVEDLEPSDNFYDLGGDSLLALEVAATLSKELNITVNAQLLLEYPTLESLTKYITSNSSSDSCILEMKPGDSSNPLFLIHPIEGELFCFQGFTQSCHCNQAIYGLRSPNEKFKSLEELAHYYLKQIKEKQPNGAIHLIGASFGGIVAYEITKQLMDNNEQIGLIALLDSGLPSHHFKTLKAKKDKLDYLISFLCDDKELKPDASQLFEILGLQKLSEQEKEKIYKTIEQHLDLLTSYQPQAIDQEVHLFESSHDDPLKTHEGISGPWKKLLKDQLKVYEFNGDHLSMLKTPNLNSFINKIESIQKRHR